MSIARPDISPETREKALVDLWRTGNTPDLVLRTIELSRLHRTYIIPMFDDDEVSTHLIKKDVVSLSLYRWPDGKEVWAGYGTLSKTLVIFDPDSDKGDKSNG